MSEKLKEQIRALVDGRKSVKGSGVSEDKRQKLQQLRGQIDRMMRDWKPAAPQQIELCGDLLDVSSGEYLEHDGQKIFILREEYPVGFRHGVEMLNRFLRCDPIAFKKFAKLDGMPSLSETLFLDTETTGLAGGTGTLAFLIGYGFFEKNNFVVENIFLPEPKSEKLALSAFRERTRNFNHLVTYNGKAFDLNVLRARYIINREEFHLGSFLHSDLLFVSRRLWKYGLLDCKLLTVESEILKGYRQKDVGSDKVADLYFHYLRFGPHRELGLIFEHNRYDILSLVSLAIRVSDLFSSVNSVELLPSEMWGLARFHLENGETEKAIEFLEGLIEVETKTELAIRAGWELSLCYKSRQMWERAERMWLKLKDSAELFPKPHIELIKYYEHKKRDVKRAMSLAIEAKEMVSIVRDTFRHSTILDDISRRIERVSRKGASFSKLKRDL